MENKLIKDKRGISAIGLFEFMVTAFIIIIIIATLLYAFGIIDGELTGGNIIAGGSNISNDSANTVGKINTAFLNTADLIGILFLFGMVIAIILTGFLTRERHPAVLFIIDIIIIIFAYILAVYISNSFETVLGILPFTDLIASNLNNSSRFLLLLPKITLITGALTLIVTYAGIPKTREEDVAGF